MSAVGRGEMRAADVARSMHPDYKEERAAVMAQQPKAESDWFGLKRAASVRYKVPGTIGPAIPIRGTNSDLPVRFAPNGGAVPGDRIVGILTPGEGITIYPIQSPLLKDFEDKPERWLDLRWDVDDATPQRFPARSPPHHPPRNTPPIPLSPHSKAPTSSFRKTSPRRSPSSNHRSARWTG